MKKTSLMLIILAFCLSMFAENREITPIALIQNNHAEYDGQTVTIEGVVTIGAESKLHTTQLKAYIQDESMRGIQLFDYDVTSAYERDIIRGNKLRITGTVTQFNDITEIEDFTIDEVIATNQEVPVVSLTLDEAADYSKYEGTFVQVEGKLTEDPYNVGGGYNLTFVDNNGDNLAVRVWASTGIDVSNLKQGFPIIARGAVAIFSNNTQVTPGKQEDIEINAIIPIFSSVTTLPATPYYNRGFKVTTEIAFKDTLSKVEMYWKFDNENDFKMIETELVDGKYEANITETLVSKPEASGYVVYFKTYKKNQPTDVNHVFLNKSDEYIIEVDMPKITSFSYSFDSQSLYPADYPFEKTALASDSVKVEAEVYDVAQNLVGVNLMIKLEDDGFDFTEMPMERQGSKYVITLPPLNTTSVFKAKNYVFYVAANFDDGFIAKTAKELLVIKQETPLLYKLSIDNTPALRQKLDVSVKIIELTNSMREIIKPQAFYTVDYSTDATFVDMTFDEETGLYKASLNPVSSGSFVTIGAWASSAGGTAIVATDDNGNKLQYTYPVVQTKAILKIEPRPVNSFDGDKIAISYNSKQDDKVILRIYSAEGKLVQTLKNEYITHNNANDAFSNTFYWNGKDDKGKHLPIGLYICHLQVTNPSTGAKKTAKAPIVIGAKLN